MLGHVAEVGGEGGVDPLPVVAGRADRAGDRLDQPVHALVEQRQVELLLAREVLVEHRLADSGPFRDLVHRRGVVAAGDEDLYGRVQQLPPAGEPRQAGSPGSSGRSGGHCVLRVGMMSANDSPRSRRRRPFDRRAALGGGPSP